MTSSQATQSRIKVRVNSRIGRWSRVFSPEHYCLVGPMRSSEKLCLTLDPAEDAVAGILAMETPVTIWTGIDHPVGKIGYPKSTFLYAKIPIFFFFLKKSRHPVHECLYDNCIFIVNLHSVLAAHVQIYWLVHKTGDTTGFTTNLLCTGASSAS